jgi:F0F1-type ATP synthase membrane subunit c/vacuolar-type H+-ATPase subunit K
MYTNQTVNQNAKAVLNTTRIIHLALLAGQAMFGLVAFSITPKNVVNAQANNNVLFWLVPVIAIGSAMAGHLIYQQLMKSSLTKISVKEKIQSYRAATIIRDALLESPSLFAIVAFILTGSKLLMIIPLFVIGYFIYLMPTKDKMENDLGLSYEEKSELDSI